MFWEYPIWFNAFIVQSVILTVAFIYGRKKKINQSDLFLIISLYAPVPILKTSYGVSGLILFSDIICLFLFFAGKRSVFFSLRNRTLSLLFVLYIIWPISSTILSLLDTDILTDSRILLMQIMRYLVYFSVAFHVYNNYYRIIKSFKSILDVQIVLITLLSFAILLNYSNIINVDAWWELKQYELFDDDMNIGKGAMFFYRAGIGCFTTIAAIILMYKLNTRISVLYKTIIVLTILSLLINCVLSGSRQGLIFFILSFILCIWQFKFSRKTILFLSIFSLFTVVLIIYYLAENTFLTNWFSDRFLTFFNDKDPTKLLVDRNFRLEEADVKFSSLYNILFGRGLGGDIVSTESDFFNAFSYFGVVGLSIYVIFLFKFFKKIKLNSSSNRLSFVVVLIASLFGFQQWFLMSWGAAGNASNTVLIVFFIGIGIRNIKLKK